MNEAALGRRLRVSGFWAAGGRILSGLLVLSLHGVLTRTLSGNDYGSYALIESMALLLTTICLAGVPTVAMRLIRERLTLSDASGASQIVTSSAALILATSLITILTTAAIAQLHALPGGFDGRWMPLLGAWAVLAAGLRLSSEIYRGYDRYRASYLIGGQSGGLVVNACLLMASLAAIVTGRFSLQTILVIQVLVQLAFLLLSVADHRGHLSAVTEVRCTGAAGMLLFAAWPLLTQQLVSVGLPEAGKLMLGVYAAREEIGFYNAAVRLVLLAHVPLLVVNNAIQPFIAELYAGHQHKQMMILTRGTATLAAVPCVAVMGTFVLFPEFVLELAFGPTFSAAAPTLRMLTIGSLVWVLSGSCGLVLMMTGHERSAMLGTVVPGLVYLILCPLAIQHYGAYGAAIGATLLHIGSNSLCLLLVRSHLRIWTAVTCSLPLVRDCVRMLIAGRESHSNSKNS